MELEFSKIIEKINFQKMEKLIFTTNSTIIIHKKIYLNFCGNLQKDIKFEDSAIVNKSRNPLDVGCSDSNFLFFQKILENAKSIFIEFLLKINFKKLINK